MCTGIYQSWITVAVVIVFYATDLLMMSRFDQKRSSKSSGRSWDYTLMVAAMVTVLVAQPVLFPWLGLHIDAWWGAPIQVAGLLLLLGGLGLHWWARAHLRQFYAERVELQPEHHLIDTGPYAYMRHPMFTSYFLLAIGLLLINPALPALLVTSYALWDFTRAAKREERLLSENVLGYNDYMARTPRFLPRFRRHSGGK